VIASIIQFVTTYNDTIVAVLAALILVLSAMAFYITYFMQGSPEARAERDFDRIEDSLKKIIVEIHKAGGAGSNLDKLSPSERLEVIAAKDGGKKPEDAQKKAAGAAGSTGQVDEATLTELKVLKEALDRKKQEVDELKTRIEGTKLDNTDELLAKIKKLEERLSEYEIIEDDIADLSVFKEENMRLKRELEEIKGGRASSKPPQPAAETTVDTKVDTTVDTREEAKPEPNKTQASQEPTNDIPELDASALGFDASGLAGPEAEAALASELGELAEAPIKDLALPAEDSLSVETSSESPVPVAASAEGEPNGEAPTADIFSEFAAGDNTQDDIANFDPDKMLAELSDIAGEEGSISDVEAGADMERMTQEAKKL
jgi:hypothetical protein